MTDETAMTTYIGVDENDLALYAESSAESALVVQMQGTPEKPNTYFLQQFKDGEAALWLSNADDGRWLYARY